MRPCRRCLPLRRRSIRNIRKITRTMELIATARFKKAMDRGIKVISWDSGVAPEGRSMHLNPSSNPLIGNMIGNDGVTVKLRSTGGAGAWSASPAWVAWTNSDQERLR